MDTFGTILWCIAIAGGLVAVYVAVVASKSISVKANLSLLDGLDNVIGSVEVIGSDPTQVAKAVTEFEEEWAGGPVVTELTGIEVGDVDG